MLGINSGFIQGLNEELFRCYDLLVTSMEDWFPLHFRSCIDTLLIWIHRDIPDSSTLRSIRLQEYMS